MTLEEDALRTERDDFAMRLDQAEHEISRLENLLRDRDDELNLLREDIEDRPSAEEMTALGNAVKARDWELICDLLHRLGVAGF